MSSIIPIPACPTAIRPATLADVPFMDSLQKLHGRALGYFPTKQFEEYVQMGAVLIAEEALTEKAEENRLGLGLRLGLRERAGLGADPTPTRTPTPLPNLHPNPNLSSATLSSPTPLGYLISRDRYLKRDELGVIYQLCVVNTVQRKLIGAALIKEALERSAYGCKLYCCWCAQDLDANYFWESLGFVPLAFRTGSKGKGRGGRGGKGRVHIFWQRRICV